MGLVEGRTFGTGRHEMLLTTGTVARRAAAASLLPGALRCAIVATVWFALNQQVARGPAVLGWVTPPVSLGLAALALRATAGTPGLAAPAARFWGRIALVAAATSAG